MDSSKRLPPRTVVVLGIPFNDVSFDDTVEWTRQRVLSRKPAYIATANMDFIMQAWRDPELQRILLEADLVVADGIPIVWLSRLLGPGLKGRVTGSDLVPRLAKLAAGEGFGLFGLGGAPGVAEKAMAKLAERFPGLRIAGCYSPPKADLLDMDNPAILSRLKAASPDILFVAFGAPKQEKWVNLHIRGWSVPVSMGVGGSLDFLAGAQKRAPRWVQALALEWLWRMLSDPPRLVRRYIANFAFLSTAAATLLRLRWGPVPPPPPAPAAGAPDPLAGLGAVRIPFPVSNEVDALERFRAAGEAGLRNGTLVVDAGPRAWMDSLELGILLDLGRLSRARGRRLFLLAPHPRLARLLRFVRLDRYLNVAETAAEAAAGLGEQNGVAAGGRLAAGADRRLAVALPKELTAVNVGAFAARVQEAWRALEDQGRPDGVTVDASGLDFIDTAGLSFLVATKKRTEQAGASFRCSGFRDAALRSVKLARLEQQLAEPAAPAAG